MASRVKPINETQRFNNTERVVEKVIEQELVLPRSMANQKFKYVHYLSAWRFFADADGGKGEFLPQLGQLIAKPSANGVLKDGNMEPLIRGSVLKGGTVIDDQDPRLGKYQYYVGRAACEGGRRRYSFYADGVVKVGEEYRHDHNGEVWLAFLKHIKDAGIVPAMSSIVFRSRLQAMDARATKLASKEKVRQSVVDAAEAKLTAMQKAWDKDVKHHAAAAKSKAVRGTRGPINTGAGA